MNKKGFTLVEALLVLAVIGVLLLTLIPSIITITNKNKQKACENTKKNIISAAKMFVTENKYDFDFDCDDNSDELSVADLQDYGYLKDNDSLDNKYYDEPVVIRYYCSTKTFEYIYNVSCES